MSLTILSTQSKAIQKLIKEQMRQETEELGFDPYGDSGQEEFERRVMDLEQQSLEHPEIDWERSQFDGLAYAVVANLGRERRLSATS
mgnify:CR=1 FL=1